MNAPLKRTTTHLVALSALLCSAGCADSASGQWQASTDFGPQIPLSSEATLLDQLAAGPASVPHFGIREVQLFEYDEQGALADQVIYRESVAVDSEGRFALEPLAALTPVEPDEPTFLALLGMRSGYAFRYRDFMIRDQGAFLENFTLTVHHQAMLQFLGRTCFQVDVDSIDGLGVDYDLLVDSATGLVLASQALDAETGQLVQRQSYVSFSLGTPIDFVPDEPSNGWQTLDLFEPLPDQVGAAVSLPTYLPQGYVLSEAATVIDPDGLRWLVLTCTDGVEPLFVLERLDVGTPLDGLQLQGAIDTLDEQPSDRLIGFRAGRLSVVQGLLGSSVRAALGPVEPVELQVLLESTVD